MRDEALDNRFYELHSKGKQTIQDGPKEYLLCEPCDNKIIGTYEKYFKEAIHFHRHNVEPMHDDKIFVIENLDYKKMKLFFLSLLWRMSISSKPEFADVCIGGNEDLIRTMIMNEDPGKSFVFPVTAIVPLINQRNWEGWITNTFVSQNQQVTTHSVVLGGILYSISATQSSVFSEQSLLNESGRWVMPLMDVSEIPFLWEAIKHLLKKK